MLDTVRICDIPGSNQLVPLFRDSSNCRVATLTSAQLGTISTNTNQRFEAIACDPDKGKIYVGTEEAPMSIWSLDYVAGTFQLLIDVQNIPAWTAQINEISGMTYDPIGEMLYVLSAANKRVLQSTLSGTVVGNPLSVSSLSSPEGLSFEPTTGDLIVFGEPREIARYVLKATKSPISPAPKAPPSAPTTTPTQAPTKAPTEAPNTNLRLGALKVTDGNNLRLSQGLTATVIARVNTKVQYTSPESTATESTLNFHANADGADIFALPDGGYIYASNAELGSSTGGVFGVEMDKDGLVRNYKPLITGTSRNCNGGRTPWNTWVTCEEVTGGQCWQVDPTGVRTGEATVVGQLGGSYEAFAFDARNTSAPSYYITEDTSTGALRRYRPPAGYPMVWESLHLTNGTHDYLILEPSNNTFRWSSSLAEGRTSANLYFRNSEGIAIQNGKLAFVAKAQKELFLLDLDALTYSKISTSTGPLVGGGNFDGQPDHLLVESPSGVYIFSEDGSNTPGMFGYDGSKYFSYFESNFVGDEITGIAFSPDRKFLFAAVQRAGLLFRIARDDGLAFEGRRVLKWKKELGH